MENNQEEDQFKESYIELCSGCGKLISLKINKEIKGILINYDYDYDYDYNEMGYFCKTCYTKAYENKCEICNNNCQCGGQKFNYFINNIVICYHCIKY